MPNEKKLSIIAILKLLQEKSSQLHPLSYDKIVDLLKHDYDFDFEKRAVARNVKYLIDFGYDIVITSRGAYMNQGDYAEGEIKYLVDSVLSNKYIPRQFSSELINKLLNQTTKELKEHTKYVNAIDDWNKTPNNEVFLNIELIDEAIANKKQISFDYNAFNTRYELVPKHPDRRSVVSPYRMIVKNQRYYLMSKNTERGNLSYYKIDKITNMRILKADAEDINTLPSFFHGVDDEVLSDALPYMFSDIPTKITVELKDKSMIDVMYDWFGKKVNFIERADGRVVATCKSSPLAMKYWALQYMDEARIMSPASLVMDIKNELNKAIENYS